MRGFKRDGVQGDSGFVSRNSYEMPLGSLLQRDFLNPYSLSFFWDYGRVSSHNANYATRMLSGMGVELSAQYKYFETSLTYATVTHKSEELRDDGAFYLNTSFTHTF